MKIRKGKGISKILEWMGDSVPLVRDPEVSDDVLLTLSRSNDMDVVRAVIFNKSASAETLREALSRVLSHKESNDVRRDLMMDIVNHPNVDETSLDAVILITNDWDYPGMKELNYRASERMSLLNG